MEHNHKNTDCYFFYYSTCKKGDNCPFRHEPSALGCETVCSYWQQGNCLNEHCNFRHMELKKNRKLIPCYWETQPGGCRKPHCSFLHKHARAITGDPINPVKTSDLSSKSLNQEWLNRQDDTKYDGSSTESDQGRGSSEAGSFIGSPAVDPLIVKFEEESDNESVPSPVKTQPGIPYCKTYEEIRLEEIQAESAAYYSYDQRGDIDSKFSQRNVNRSSMTVTIANNRSSPYSRDNRCTRKVSKNLDFKILTLEEIRQRKKKTIKLNLKSESSHEQSPKDEEMKTDRLDVEVQHPQHPQHRQHQGSTVPIANPSETTISTRGIKRTMDDRKTDRKDLENPQSKSPKNVPPIKLRRPLKKFTSTTSSNEKPENNVAIERREESVQRLEEDRAKSEVERDENLTSNKRQKVEIRSCDSSTNEEKNQVEETLTTILNKDTKTLVEEKKCIVKKSSSDLMNCSEEDYLMLDTSSDDILSDIDALLKKNA